MVITTLKDWCEQLSSLIADGEDHLTFIHHKQIEVAYGGWEEDADLDYCAEHNIPVYNQNRNGGTIVCCPGNIGLGIIYTTKEYREFIFIKMLREFGDWLKNKGLSVEFVHNDILIDGYKVASGCGYNIPPEFKRTYEGIQISINQDLEAIQNICTKPMVKIPKGLSEWGITTEEVYAWVDTWFKENLKDYEGVEEETETI